MCNELECSLLFYIHLYSQLSKKFERSNIAARRVFADTMRGHLDQVSEAHLQRSLLRQRFKLYQMTPVGLIFVPLEKLRMSRLKTWISPER